MLTNRLPIFVVQLGIALFDDFTEAYLCQFFGDQLLIEKSALNRRFILYKGRNDLVQVFLTNAFGLFAFRLDQSFDFDLELASVFVEPDIALFRVIPAFTIVEVCLLYTSPSPRDR